MSNQHLAVLDDEPDITQLIARYLGTQGFRVSELQRGAQLMDLMAGDDPPALVMLDLGLPGEDGFAIARQLREHHRCGLIIVTGRGDAIDKVVGLEVGADDYVTKPFSPRELIARVAAILRRIRPALAGEVLTVGDLSLDTSAHRIVRRGETVSLGPTEFRLLKHFMEHPGRVFSRGQLLDAVWGNDSDIELRTVDVHIRRLRKGIELPGAPDPVRTVRSAGYSLEAV